MRTDDTAVCEGPSASLFTRKGVNEMNPPTTRKPHSDFAGYRAELRNKYSGGHTVISDCKLAVEQGSPLVEDYVLEGGRYQVLCNEHGHLIYCSSMPVARDLMKDPTEFCMVCRCIAGEGPENWEWSLAPHDVAAVWLRRAKSNSR
jgi:hypothetical protein